MKLNKEEFDKLYSENITKKEYNEIIKKIDRRFSEIMLDLKPSIKKRGWFDYGNCTYTDSNGSYGYFDRTLYEKEIMIGGEYAELPEPFSYYIPTKWLWQDYREEFDSMTREYIENLSKKKAQAKIKAQQRKLKKDKLKLSIKNKLTEEELKIIKFK